jgi:hypothetical protein
MTTYVFRDGRFVDKRTGEPMLTGDEPLVAMPQYMPDVPHYASPIDGQMITSRSHRREDLKRNNCVDAGDLPRLNGGFIKSEKFARKHGLRWIGDQ